MQNLTTALALAMLGGIHLSATRSERKEAKRYPETISKHPTPPNTVTRQQLRKQARDRAKVERSAMKVSRRMYGRAVRKATAE